MVKVGRQRDVKDHFMNLLIDQLLDNKIICREAISKVIKWYRTGYELNEDDILYWTSLCTVGEVDGNNYLMIAFKPWTNAFPDVKTTILMALERFGQIEEVKDSEYGKIYRVKLPKAPSLFYQTMDQLMREVHENE